MEDRTTRAGCRCENVVFVFFCHAESGGLYVRGVHSSNKYVTAYGSILMRFSLFFQKGSAFQRQYMVLIFVARWRHKFREMRSKLRKVQKSAEKFVRTTSCG